MKNDIFKRVVFLEGLSGVGKSTLAKYIEDNYNNVLVSHEIIEESIYDNINKDQDKYLLNDKLKYFRENDNNYDILLIDRGFISTYAYNLTKNIIDNNFKNDEVCTYFNEIKSIFKYENVKVIYLNSDNITIPYNDSLDPYGSILNQKLLRDITLYICRSNVLNLTIKDYDYNKDFMEVINEIVN